jgi:hypothetical protein
VRWVLVVLVMVLGGCAGAKVVTDSAGWLVSGWFVGGWFS